MTAVALITGGQRGIGFGIAQKLVSAGFKVALVAPEQPDANDVRTALQELGDQAQFFCHDVRDVEDHSALIESIETTLGAITTLVSNAGIGSPVRADMLDVAPSSFDQVMDVNARGAFFLAQAVARHMLAQPSTLYHSLIFIGSVSAQMVSVERAEYCMSKATLAMMASLFAVRLAGEGIGVFELRPGIIETPMTAGVKDTYDARIANGLIPAGRWGQPNDIADAVLPLVRGDMAYATGSVIHVDGALSTARL